MPTQAVRALHCLVRSQGRQVILLTARKAVANLLPGIHYKALKLATEHQADVGGWAAAERVDHALTKLDSILHLLNQANRDLRAAISELSTYTVATCGRGGCLAQVRRCSIA